MSTVEVRIKAARSLMKMRTEFDKMFPKIYILGNKTCPFINPLRRLVGDMACDIEEMNISEAFNIIYGRPIQPEEYDMVDWNINQAGALYKGELYNPEGFIRKVTINGGGRPEEVEFTPMDKDWQEKRERAAKEAETEEAPEEVQEVAEVPADAEPKVCEDIERQMIIDALAECKWIKTNTADCLGITVDTLNKRIKKYNIIIDKKK